MSKPFDPKLFIMGYQALSTSGKVAVCVDPIMSRNLEGTMTVLFCEPKGTANHLKLWRETGIPVNPNLDGYELISMTGLFRVAGLCSEHTETFFKLIDEFHT
jgi:hypothetical protein